MPRNPRSFRPAADQSLPNRLPPRPKLRLHVQADTTAKPAGVDRAQMLRWVRAALEQSAELTLRFVGISEGRRLNRQFRGKNYATNVLTFDYGAGLVDGMSLTADIVICTDVVAREARAQGKTLKDHLAHLVIHGTLHAQGWDHETEPQALAMETLEIELLKRFRIASPY
jgi:probable rRNA maturation factor